MRRSGDRLPQFQVEGPAQGGCGPHAVSDVAVVVLRQDRAVLKAVDCEQLRVALGFDASSCTLGEPAHVSSCPGMLSCQPLSEHRRQTGVWP